MQLIFDKYDKAVGKISSDFMEDLEEFAYIVEQHTGLLANVMWTTAGERFEASELVEVSVKLFKYGMERNPGCMRKALRKIEKHITTDKMKQLLDAFKNTAPFDDDYIMIKIYV